MHASLELAAWSPAVPAVLVALCWLWLPGLPVARWARLPWWCALGLAPLLSLGIIGATAILPPIVVLGWGPLPVALATVSIWGAVLGHGILRRRTRDVDPLDGGVSPPGGAHIQGARHGQRPVRESLAWPLAAGMILAGLLTARLDMLILGRPEAISQTYDNVFHLNAVRWILQTADASSLHLGGLTASQGATAFYPAGWHGLVALVLRTIGSQDVALGTSATVIAVTAGVWVCGAMALVRDILPSPLLRVGLPAAGVLVASFPGFPILLLRYGILYPNLLGFALLPAALVLLRRVLHSGIRAPRGGFAVCMGLGTIALGSAHPNALMALLGFSVPLALAEFIQAWCRYRVDRAPARDLRITALMLGGAVLALCLLWPVVRPPAAAASWQPTLSVLPALRDAMLQNPGRGLPRWFLAALFLVGFFRLVREGRLALPLLWALTALGWVAAAAFPSGSLRTSLVGVFYNDPLRLAALLTIPSVPIAATGGAVLAAAGRTLVLRLRRRGSSWDSTSTAPEGRVGWTALIAVLLSTILTQPTAWMREAVEAAAGKYEFSSSSALLTPDEKELFGVVAKAVPAGGVVAVESWNGGSLLYAYTGIPVSRYHTLQVRDADDALIDGALDTAASDSDVCGAVRRQHISFALDLGPQQVDGMSMPRGGFDELGTAPGFELVAQRGEARLYRLTVCQG